MDGNERQPVPFQQGQSTVLKLDDVLAVFNGSYEGKLATSGVTNPQGTVLLLLQCLPDN